MSPSHAILATPSSRASWYRNARGARAGGPGGLGRVLALVVLDEVVIDHAVVVELLDDLFVALGAHAK